MDASQSPSAIDDDYFDDQDDLDGGSRPGRKKGPANQAARRDQNRIAQREFRLRKQQRIRDLEARVEILSGTKEETHAHTLAIIQGLIDENARLRGLVRDLSGFIGEGLGGPLLDKTGWTMTQFKDFVNRADSDTAYESFVKAKAAGAGAGNSTSKKGSASTSSTAAENGNAGEGSGTGRKRKRDSTNGDDAVHGGPSTSRRSSSAHQSPHTPTAQPPLGPPPPPRRPGSPNELHSMLPNERAFRGNTRDLGAPSSFSSLVSTLSSSAAAPFVDFGGRGGALAPDGPRSGGSLPAPPVTSQTPPAGSVSSSGGAYTPDMSFGVVGPNGPATPGTPKLSAAEVEARRAQLFAENEPKRKEAGKLIKYHLDNYRRNENYFLPASLRPTLVQRTVSHDPLVDGIIYPEVRDRMILLKDQYDFAKCLTEFLWTVIIHGDDVLAHNNWELGEQWLRTYGFLVDDGVLACCNKWRRARGDVELTMADIQPDNNSPSEH
ncbi:hypothetical protein DL93DRAFT_2081116 [Clavulina sp. PMI_390]|nr:hypothetical protein DL93DRAFT_2081116 [Clavulina sp. PMI_390]